ncbi:hypothetical protein DVH24_038534 [Malus domestica]|uniref:Uncharacterized protein n=1 Tax=Malus domestica TaxID=3750 RepID=A0A498K7N7_MALDO|nr:hypothetical protein DVH24_038534 [Malus domestica]
MPGLLDFSHVLLVPVVQERFLGGRTTPCPGDPAPILDQELQIDALIVHFFIAAFLLPFIAFSVAISSSSSVIKNGEFLSLERSDAGEVKKWAVSAVERDQRRRLGWRSGRAVVGIASASEVEAGDEGFERRVAVDEGGEEVGPIFDDRGEGEDEEGEEDEGGEVASERRCGLS